MVITNLVVFRQTGDSHKLDLFFCLSNIGPNPTATRPTVDWRYKMVISCNWFLQGSDKIVNDQTCQQDQFVSVLLHALYLNQVS